MFSLLKSQGNSLRRHLVGGVVGLLLSAAPLVAAVPPPFTLTSALNGIAREYPEARRVSDELPAGVTATEAIPYKQTGDGKLQLDVYRPARSTLRPAVLLVHGGGWVAGDRTMERPFAKQLAARGYVAVPVSYRLGEAGRFPNAIHDLKDAVRWLRGHAQEYGIDPASIGIVGGSAGGTLAAFVGATNGLAEFEDNAGFDPAGSTVQAVVVLDGLATFLDNALIQQSEGPPSPYYVYQHGTYRAARATWVQASPLTQVGPHSAPTFFIKSTATRPILPGRDEMAGRLRLFGIDAHVIQFPNTPHVFWLFHPWFPRMVDEVDGFLSRHLRR